MRGACLVPLALLLAGSYGFVFNARARPQRPPQHSVIVIPQGAPPPTFVIAPPPPPGPVLLQPPPPRPYNPAPLINYNRLSQSQIYRTSQPRASAFAAPNQNVVINNQAPYIPQPRPAPMLIGQAAPVPQSPAPQQQRTPLAPPPPSPLPGSAPPPAPQPGLQPLLSSATQALAPHLRPPAPSPPQSSSSQQSQSRSSQPSSQRAPQTQQQIVVYAPSPVSPVARLPPPAPQYRTPMQHAPRPPAFFPPMMPVPFFPGPRTFIPPQQPRPAPKIIILPPQAAFATPAFLNQAFTLRQNVIPARTPGFTFNSPAPVAPAISKQQFKLKSQTEYVDPTDPRPAAPVQQTSPTASFASLFAAKDLDCDTPPESAMRETNGLRCHDDMCLGNKVCRNLGGVGLCCPPHVSNNAIQTRASFGFFGF